MGRENGVSQGTISYGASKDLILVCTVQLKQMIKSHFSGKLVSSISNVAFTSVYSEKTCLKKLIMMNMMMMMLMMMIIITNKSQETSVFRGCQKLTSAMQKYDGRLQI